RFSVLQSKLVDRREVRVLPTSQHPKRYVFVGGSGHLARRKHPHRVPVDQQCHHHRRCIRPLPTPVLPLNRSLDGPKVQRRRHHVQDEVGQVPFLQPLQRRGRQQERLRRCPRAIALCHRPHPIIPGLARRSFFAPRPHQAQSPA